ncbi:hypothetical protein GRT41_34195 [Burkholderia pseudomallei]|nr:hypothetical protein [Burkholderia pseudomallei]
MLLQQSGRFDEAEQAYRGALELQPGLAIVEAHLSDLLREMRGEPHADGATTVAPLSEAVRKEERDD